MKTYTVTVSRTCYERGVYEIEAESEEEASKIADEKLADGDDADWNPFDADCSVMSCEVAKSEAWNIQHRAKGEWRWIEWGQFDYSDANYLKVQSDLKQRATQNGASYRVFDAQGRIVFQATA